MHQLNLSIDRALAVSYRRNMYEGEPAFVGHITLVKGVPFYGYHVGYKFFLKIYMLNPLHMTRLADLLRQGTIMKKVIQPYESHMQYVLQWMCDYNLYGCAFIDCSKVKFRSPVPDYLDMESTAHQWHNRTIPHSSISDNEAILRQSHCSIEVDVRVQHILNRLDVKSRPIHHDFIERKSPITTDTKLVQSMAGLWRDETKRRRARMGETDPESSPFPPEVLVSVSADPRSTQLGGWIHEKEYMEKIELIVQDERQQSDGEKITFDGFVENERLGNQVPSSLESVEDLFPENLARIMVSRLASAAATDKKREAVVDVPEVDEDLLLSFEKDELDAFSCDSDEELAREMGTSREKPGDRIDDESEQYASRNINEQKDDNEARLANGMPTTSLKESLRSASFANAQDMTSSAELEKMGIRNTGNTDHVHDDAFEVPLEFASYISAERSKDPAKGYQHNSKRVKLTNGDPLRIIENLDQPSQDSRQEARGVFVRDLTR